MPSASETGKEHINHKHNIMTTITKKLDCVFVIDDDSMSNLNTKRIIGKTNRVNQVFIAESAAEALEALDTKYIPAGRFPELILLDIYMPGISGWDFIEHFRKREVNKGKTKIIMFSATEDEADMIKATKNAGVSGYKIKPLNEEFIIELADDILSQ